MACNGTYSMNTYKAVESVTLELEKCYTKIVEWFSGAPSGNYGKPCMPSWRSFFVISVINQFRVKTNA